MSFTVQTSSANNSIIIRLRLPNVPGSLGRAISAIGQCGGNIGSIDIAEADSESIVRDISVFTSGPEQKQEITKALLSLDNGIKLVSISDRTFLLHAGGKIEVVGRQPIRDRNTLSMAYTPGVARVCTDIHLNPDHVFDYTIKGNMVAIVSDGTAVLGLGDIGPEAGLPVMEGKAQLFKDFGGVNAFPVCLATKDTEEIINAVKWLAPNFGGINLEDISAPRCFEIERRLKAELDIPVFHDDQHGTAVVTTAAFINALKVTGKKAEDVKVVVLGIGAAGTACTKMLMELGVKNIIGLDRNGAVTRDRTDLNSEKRAFAEFTNPNQEKGTIHEVIRGADVFLGLSGPNMITVEDLKAMASDPIVFAMANPDPEIAPELAYPHVAVMATGRSDYPNQINNVLCFPGMFKGALAVRARDINEEMKMAAARAIAETIPEETVSADYIIPSVFDLLVVEKVSEAVRQAAIQTGVARID